VKPQIKIGSILEGTLRAQDIIPALLNECFRREISYAKVIDEANESWENCGLRHNEALVVLGGKIVAMPGHEWWDKDLDNGQGWTNHEENASVIKALTELLDSVPGCTFGPHPDDPACLGYWAEPNEDTRGEGVYFMWERKFPGLAIMRRPPFAKEDSVFMQDEDMHKFQMEIGAVDFVWMNDPENKEGRVFATIEKHYDAIMEPYFDRA